MARTRGQAVATLAASLALLVATLETVGAAALPRDLQAIHVAACKAADECMPVTPEEGGGESLMQESVAMHRTAKLDALGPLGTSLMQESFSRHRTKKGSWTRRVLGAHLAPAAASNSSSTDASTGSKGRVTAAALGNSTGAATTQLNGVAEDAFEDAGSPRTAVAAPVPFAAGRKSEEPRNATALVMQASKVVHRFFEKWSWVAPQALNLLPVLLIVLSATCIVRLFLNKAMLPLRRHQQRHPGAVSPFSATAANAQRISGVDEGPFLCPELVVPRGKECTLVVPRFPPGGEGSTLSITDVHGLVVMRASYTVPASGRNSRRARARDLKRLILSSATGEAAFAFCRDVEEAPQSGPATSSLGIYNRSEERFGVLGADGYQAGSGHSVITQKGSRIYFRVAAQDGSLNATDDSGRLLADVKPTPTHHAVRIGQSVDAGLIILTVLGIGLLEVAEAGSKEEEAD